jgi:hypothetical protein
VARLDASGSWTPPPSGLLYATYEHRLIAELDHPGYRGMSRFR